MCPKCSKAFSPKRLGFQHVSPRFGTCTRYMVAINDKLVGNVYEACAGEQGFAWYTGKELCDCGSGMQNLGLLSGKVELYHEAHPVQLTFDDGSTLTVTCPEMHYGPHHTHTTPQLPQNDPQPPSEGKDAQVS